VGSRDWFSPDDSLNASVIVMLVLFVVLVIVRFKTLA
jgi:hypothetical protein